MNTELLEALTILEQEKNISKDTMMDAIENSLISACKNHFGTSDNIKVIMNRETCDYAVFAEKEVVDEVMDPALEISLEEAEQIDSSLQLGDVAQIRVESKSFGRIATQNAKNLILQKPSILLLPTAVMATYIEVATKHRMPNDNPYVTILGTILTLKSYSFLSVKVTTAKVITIRDENAVGCRFVRYCRCEK